jgi:hypothetical protein
MQGPEGRPPNVSPTRKGWEIDPEADSGAAGAAQALFFRNRPFLQRLHFLSETALSLQQPPFPYSNRPFLQQPPFPTATALSLQLPSPICHPERSRGICSSADLSWKCFRQRSLNTCLRILQSDLNYLTGRFSCRHLFFISLSYRAITAAAGRIF